MKFKTKNNNNKLEVFNNYFNSWDVKHLTKKIEIPAVEKGETSGMAVEWYSKIQCFESQSQIDKVNNSKWGK